MEQPKWMQNKLAYDRKYAKENLKQIIFVCNRNADADIIAFLEELPNKSEYIKNLIRNDMNEK